MLWTEGQEYAFCPCGDLESFLIDASWTMRDGRDLETQFGRREVALEGRGTV